MNDIRETSYNYGRRPNFSTSELQALVSGVEKHRDVVLPRDGTLLVGTHAATNKSRTDAWKEITEMVNVVTDTRRGLQEVIKRWRYLKSRTKVKARRLTRWDKPLNELQLRVLNVVGEEDTPGTETNNDDDGWDMDIAEYEVGVEESDDYGEDESTELTVDLNNSGQEITYESSTTPPLTTAQVSSLKATEVVLNTTKDQQAFESSVQETNIIRHRPKSMVPTSAIMSNGLRHAFQTAEYERHNTQGYKDREEDFHDTMLKRSHDIDHVQQGESFRRPTRERPRNESTRLTTDKSNVNITVQSCCKSGNNLENGESDRLDFEKRKLELERQRLEIEKERLYVEKERLCVEKERLCVEKERLLVEKERLPLERQKSVEPLVESDRK